MPARLNATLLRLDHRIGTMDAGKEADLIAVAGNRLEDLRIFTRSASTCP